MEMTERIARCAEELSDVILQAQIVPGRYLTDFVPVLRPAEAYACGVNMGDNHHYPMGTEPLRLGFTGVAEAAKDAHGKDPVAQANLDAIVRVYGALAQLHMRAGLSPDRPKNFLEALQLYYTLWRMRSIDNTSSIGRLDQYLYPYYQTGETSDGDVLEALVEFWQLLNKRNSGDTLVTILLGGSDEHGADVTNELSVLMIEASLRVRGTEPHVSVRLHSGANRVFREKVLELMALGHGQASVYYDEQIIPKLTEAGIPPALACQYVNNGCTEIMLDRQGLIEFENLEAVKILELTLFRGIPPRLPGEPVGRYWTNRQAEQIWETNCDLGFDSGDVLEARDYEAVEAAYLRQFDHQLKKQLDFLVNRVRRQRVDGAANALLNGSYPQTLTTGGDVVRGDLGHDCLMIFSGSLPTAADGLAAIRQVVFERKDFSMAQVLEALRHNFAGHEALRARLLAAPKFGNDDDLPDEIAARLEAHFCRQVKIYGEMHGCLIWPALIGYKFVQEALVTGATPDGRQWKDPICEHYSPTPGKAVGGPTALLCSAAKARLCDAFGVAPVHISLSRQMADSAAEKNGLLASLVESAGKMGLNMLNVAIYDVAEMRAAQRDPARYAGLVVRVWGYSARFIDLSPEMQEHVISRVARTGA